MRSLLVGYSHVPERPASRIEEARQLAFTTTQAGRLYYEIHGDGPAVILAHGAEGNTLSWFQQVPVFAERYRTILYDHRGFGRSTCAPGDLQPSRFGGDLLAVMDAAGVERAAVVAQSMAGWSAIQAALAAPERITAIVLSATSGGLAAPGGDDDGAGDGDGDGAEPDDRPLAGRLSQLALAPGFPGRRPDLAFLFDQISILNPNIELLASRLGLPENLIDPRALNGFSIPTLVMACGHDAFFPPALLRRAAGMIPGAEITEMEHAGHAPYWEVPEAFNETALSFLTRHWDGVS